MVVNNEKENSTKPVTIGILCTDIAKHLLDELPKSMSSEEYTFSYVCSGYVRFLEESGAHVVPIFIGRPRSYYEDIMKKVNGILIPGGAVHLEKSAANPNDDKRLTNHMVESSGIIFEIATRQNAFFPIFGICLGFQLMLYHSAVGENRSLIRIDCQPMRCALPITVENNVQESRMFRGLDEDFVKLMETTYFGVHNHHYCVTRQALKQYNIQDQWRVLATNYDGQGLEFINFVEHKSFPIYGCQIHPERNPDSNSEDCRQILKYIADFFIAECGKSENNFEESEENNPLKIIEKVTTFPKELVKYFIYSQKIEKY